jgi:serine/threonine protein kinase
MNLIAGTTLQNGKYLVNHVLQQQGLGLTLQSTQLPENRAVILKTLQASEIAESQLASIKQRFAEQIQRFSQCNHPNLECIVDSFTESGMPFAVLNSIPGCTLAELTQAIGPISEEQAIQYIQQIGAALTVIHQRGLLHRAVTPQNIICLESSGDVILTNVGFAHPSVLGWRDGSTPPPAKEYAAIEQYQAQLTPTPAIDIYSLAATLYFLVTGQTPVAAPLRHTSPLPSPRRFCPNLSLSIEVAILKGLELNPKSRPQSIALWLSQFGQFLPSASHPIVLNQPNAIETDIIETTITRVQPDQEKADEVQAVMPTNEADSNGLGSPTINPAIHSEPKDVEHLTTNLPNGQTGLETNQTVRNRAIATSSAASSGKGRKLVMATSSAVQPQKTEPRLSKTLFSFGLTAGLIGLGFGVLLRFAAGSAGAGASFFHAEQSFPAVQNWPGDSVPSATVPPAAPSPKTSPRSRTLPKPESSTVDASPKTPQPEFNPSSVPPVAPPPAVSEEPPRSVENPPYIPPAPPVNPLPPPAPTPAPLEPSASPPPPPTAEPTPPPMAPPKQDLTPNLDIRTP